MTNFLQLCPGCFRKTDGQEICPFCGYQKNRPQSAPLLSQGVDVGGRYIVGNSIHSGGDGVTYIAWDMDQSHTVFLREFLPQSIITREAGNISLTVMNGCQKIFDECYQSFFQLWDKLAKLRGLSSLISVRTLIRDYGTVYAVIEDEGFLSLDEYLHQLPIGRMSWNALRPAIMPLLSTVDTLHKAGILHAGISPKSIHVSRDGRFFLGDFSILQARSNVGDLNVELSSGYAAAEQYGVRQKIGTWTDVYALAAVIYRCLVGIDPISASQRMVSDNLMIPGEVARNLPPYVVEAIIDALQIKPENRTVDPEEFRLGLMGSEVHKKVYPLSWYNYDEISYVNQHKKPQLEHGQYYQPRENIPSPAERGNGAGIARSKPSNSENEKKKPEETSKKSAPIAFFVILLLAVAAVAGYLLFFSDVEFFREETTTTQAPTESSYEVPDFSGRTDVSLKSDASLRDKFSLVYQEEFSVEVEKGYVIRQSAAAGTVLPRGSELIIYISLGPQELPIPDILQMPLQTARETLEKMGFVVQVEEEANDGSAMQGQIISVTPEVGTVYTQGKTVNLKVYGAPPTTAPPPTTTGSHLWNSPSSTTGSNNENSGGLGGLFSGDWFQIFR